MGRVRKLKDQDATHSLPFSAGGHQAATLGTHFDYGDQAAADPVSRLSCRPDFMILMYPVISFVDSAAHEGSRASLLGDAPEPDLATYYSNELQVKGDTPPAVAPPSGPNSGGFPDKHYLEGRVSSGDRIVLRVEAGTIFFMDVVKHDDMSRYGRRPRQGR